MSGARRVDVWLTPASRRALENVRAASDAQNDTEAIRFALRLAASLLDQRKRGARLVIIRASGETAELLMPLEDAGARR